MDRVVELIEKPDGPSLINATNYAISTALHFVGYVPSSKDDITVWFGAKDAPKQMVIEAISHRDRTVFFVDGLGHKKATINDEGKVWGNGLLSKPYDERHDITDFQTGLALYVVNQADALRPITVQVKRGAQEHVYKQDDPRGSRIGRRVVSACIHPINGLRIRPKQRAGA